VKNLQSTTLGKGDDKSLPIIPGTYPAHVSDVSVKEWNESFVYNLTFVIAPEVEKVSIDKMTVEHGELVKVTDSDGSPVKITASYLAGKTFRNSGIWLTPNPADNEKWKNRKYKQFFESLGVVFEIDKDENTVLGQVEEDDVLGFPCLVKIAREEYTDKSGEHRQAWKVFQVYPWQNGDKIDPDELNSNVPF
jgi:hypothetical protein